MADRLNVTELDFDSIKSNLKNFLRQQSEFQDYDFEGSGLSVLLDILAYNTHYNAYYLNMLANESFLDSASLRNSVVSHAKRVGYTPRSARAARATVVVTVYSPDTTPGLLTLPKGFVFYSSQLDGISYKFTTLEATTVMKTGNTFVYSNLPIYEGRLASYSFTNSYLSNPNQIFTIPDENIDTETLKVTVQQSASNTHTIVYQKSENALTVTGDSEIYFLQEGRNGQYEIYFGNNTIGKKIPDGSIVTAEYLITKAEAANKANNFVAGSSVSGLTNVVVNTITGGAGGSIRETVDEIKYGAPLSLLAQNRAVTKNDYIRLIQQKYPQFEAVNVWGGEENDPPVYGKIFVAAKPKLGFEITQTEKDYVKQNILKPMSILTVLPEIVDVDYNYLKLQINAYYDKAKLATTESQLKAGIRDIVENYTTTNLNQFNSYFRFSSVESLIDSYDRSILSNELTLFVAKKFRPILNISDSYTLDFGFELVRGTTNDNFYSSPDFTVLDEEGIARQCFFEEIPSSYTGLESVTITNPGYGYTTTPTIQIIGDGVGATATAVIVNGKLSEILVTKPGVGYTTAAVRVNGGDGQLAEASAVLQGRYGQLRIAYFKTDEVSSQSTKIIINQNTNNGVVGIIDYQLGRINIQNFKPIDVNNDFGDIQVHIRPKTNIIQSKQNKMLVLDIEDPTSIVVKTVVI